MKPEVISSRLKQMVNHKHLRKLLAKKIDDYVYKIIVEDKTEDLREVRIKRYQFLSAMLRCVNRNLDKGYVSKRVMHKIIDVFVQNNLVHKDQSHFQAVEKYKEKYGEMPPTFIVFSPTQKCNLKCVGCYAASGTDTAATLPYPIVDRIINEVYELFGGRFITISGGEPFVYKRQGKTLLDIYEKYEDMFFLVYTNGTVISKEVAQKLAKSANVTPAISVEGFEEETDQRRGAGTFKKILRAFENLRETGVPFGISVTATSKNINVLLEDKFYDFYFKEQGASYMW
jgi:sulfatase maturation enzyme AslB (radical SAM superfamily)